MKRIILACATILFIMLTVKNGVINAYNYTSNDSFHSILYRDYTYAVRTEASVRYPATITV